MCLIKFYNQNLSEQLDLDRFRLRNDLPVLVSHFTYCVMREKGERARVLSEGRKVGGRILIQTESLLCTIDVSCALDS